MTDLDLAAIADRASANLASRWPDVQVREPRELEGGHSGLTLVADLTGTDGPERIVLKVAPPGRKAVGRHDVARQARLMAELSRYPGVATPEIWFVDDVAPALAGMSFVEGECIEPVLDEHALAPGDVEARAQGAARMLAALHAVPVDEVAPGEEPTTPVGELERWIPTMEAIAPDLRPRAPDLEAALRASPPAPAHPAVLHGDYRLGNLLCHRAEARAIIDWEIWSVGDPRVDLGWFLVFTDPATLRGVAHSAPGMPEASALLDVYTAAGGHAAEQRWFDALARYKMAAIMGHNLKRHREGRYHDPYQERLPPSILNLVDEGLETLAG